MADRGGLPGAGVRGGLWNVAAGGPARRDTGPSQMLEEIPGGQNTAGPEATAPTPEGTEPIAADRDSEYVLSPVDPFDGQPHGSFAIQGVEYGEDTGSAPPSPTQTAGSRSS